MHDLDHTQLEAEFETGDSEYRDEGEWELNGPRELESPLSAVQEMELASELLGVSTEAELDQFLGRLVSGVGRMAGGFLRSDTGRALLGMLRPTFARMLPLLQQGMGASAGGQAARLLGLELEGLSPEDQELELAQELVRLAGTAAQQAAAAPSVAPPADAARAAVTAAASRHAPGLLQALGAEHATPLGGAQRSGHWVRRGRTIVVIGA